MDFRNLTDRATERIKSVFSKNNRFFYGTSDQQAEHGYQPDSQQAPVQGVYPGDYGAQPVYQQPQQQAAYYQQAPQQQVPYQQAPYQQAPYQQAPYQAAQPNPAAYQSQQPQQWPPQQEPYGAAQPYAAASPQQAQLNPQAADQPGRNRRAAQYAQSNAQNDNIVPFPGAQQVEPPQQMDAYVVNITSITGCRQAMTCLRKGQCTLVVMDQLIDKAEVRRYVDMLSGACFALGGTMTRLSQKIGFYILAPSGMMVYTDPVTASANAPVRPHPQAGPQVPQQNPYQQPAYQQPPQAMPYAQPQAYQQQAQTNPYAPPMGAVQPEYQHHNAYEQQGYAQ